MDDIKNVIDFYNSDDCQFEIKQFLDVVHGFFKNNPKLTKGDFPIIHSTKARIKDSEHLRDKIQRKLTKGIVVNPDSLYGEITDLIGVRVLHIYQDQFKFIHDQIVSNVEESKKWCFFEPPTAITWDPESESYYESLGIKTERRDTFYTSVHYIVRPNNDQNAVCCEIQVRTLFEEIWGEIDHSINYPHPTDNTACKEQLRVLSKLVSTGTRLADSIFRTYNNT